MTPLATTFADRLATVDEQLMTDESGILFKGLFPLYDAVQVLPSVSYGFRTLYTYSLVLGFELCAAIQALLAYRFTFIIVMEFSNYWTGFRADSPPTRCKRSKITA